jgi:hypothetical protein
MNRQHRRAQMRLSVELNAARPEQLTPIARERWPPPGTVRVIQAWESKRFCVQQYPVERHLEDLCQYRLTICRTTLNTEGKWVDGISWDELMQCKRDVGFGDWWGVEIYPRDFDIVNVANLRHLWIFERPLNIGWFKQCQ